MENKKIKPHNFYALAEITLLEDTQDGIYVGQALSSKITQEYYYGKILDLGEKCTIESECPDLKKGDIAMFEQIAGYHAPTEDSYCKIVRGSNIVAKVKDMEKLNEPGNYIPTRNRILVEVLKEGLVNEDGIFDSTKEDPRDQATLKGRVISCAEEADQYKPGTIVAFEPYCGNPIYNDGELFLKTVHDFDILFEIE